MAVDKSVSTDLLNSAVDLAQRAGKMSLRWFRSGVGAAQQKPDGSPVTEADRAIEEFVREELDRQYPEDSVLGEEYGEKAGRSGRTWVVDPIDGTHSLLTGVPLYATLLALLDETGPAVGVAVIPALEEAVWAGRGLGAYHRRGEEVRRAKVSDVGDLNEARLNISGLEYLPAGLGAWLAARSRGTTRTWGDGYGYVLLTTGRAEAMIDPGLSLWDVAPMLVIVPEAGGRITTASGEFHAGAGDFIATNDLLHSELLQALANLW